MAGRVARAHFDAYCPTGYRLKTLETQADNEVRTLAGKLANRHENSPVSAERLTELLEQAQERRDAARIALCQHGARCNDGCIRAKTNAPISTGFDRAPHQLKPELPGAAVLAAMIRDGQTLQGLAAVYDRADGTLRAVLSHGGFSATTGKPLRPQPAPEPAPAEQPASSLFVDQPWADQALCSQTDPEAFFPEKGGTTAPAKAVCASCLVQAECLDWALANEERFGVWGGLSERERRKIRKQLGGAA